MSKKTKKANKPIANEDLKKVSGGGRIAGDKAISRRTIADRSIMR